MKTVEVSRSVCPYDCPDCCGLLFYKENGRIVRVAGDPEHSFTRGTLCAKMAHYERTIYNEGRIQTPLLRVGKKGEGKFTPISWDEAIDRIATRWKQIMAEDGAEAIVPYSYAGTMGILQHDAYHPLFHALGASRLDRTICSPAKRAGWKFVMGETRSIAPQEAQASDFIILWGISMLATDVHFKHDIDVARKHGAHLVVIDTYETQTMHYADEGHCVKSGTDGVLALAMLHVLKTENLLDRDFLAQHVKGWEDIEAKLLPEYPPEKAAKVTGMEVDEIRALAIAYGRAKAPFIRIGSGLTRCGNGALTTRLLLALPAAVGAWKHKGGGLLSSVPGSKAFDRSLIQHPDFMPRKTRVINMCEIGNALCSLKNPPIKSLYIYSSNPATTAPDQNRVLTGLMREDLFTVVHERFLTDTTKYADIVLPATSSAEQDDIYASYGQYVVQRGRKVIEPLGEAQSNWNTARALAKAMGLTQPLFQKTETEITEEIIHSAARKWPLPEADIEKLLQGLPVDLPLPENAKSDFRTPSGKIELMNPDLPRWFPPHAQDEGDFQLVSAPDPRILDSSFNEREEFTRTNTMVLFMHPDDATKLHLENGTRVTAKNVRGAADFTLKITPRARRGVVISEGVWWQAHCLKGGINRLTSQRLTDCGGGSTFYDNRVNVVRAEA